MKGGDSKKKFREVSYHLLCSDIMPTTADMSSSSDMTSAFASAPSIATGSFWRAEKSIHGQTRSHLKRANPGES